MSQSTVQFLFATAANFKDEVACLIWPFSVDKRGYPQVGLNHKNARAHRALCQYVHGDPPTPEHQAAHSCGNKRCLNPSHIRWATRVENEKDKKTLGTYLPFAWRKRKLVPDDVRRIRSLGGTALQKDIAAQFGVSRANIGDILSGKSWKWVD